ncbi:hypothetical protein ACLOJK_001825 [Asimina triloba]
MCVSESSPPVVARAYLQQFQEDFSLFLQSRSEEVIAGGRMVLILLGRSGHHMEIGHTFYWDMLARAFSCLVSLVLSLPFHISLSFKKEYCQ